MSSPGRQLTKAFFDGDVVSLSVVEAQWMVCPPWLELENRPQAAFQHGCQ